MSVSFPFPLKRTGHFEIKFASRSGETLYPLLELVPERFGPKNDDTAERGDKGRGAEVGNGTDVVAGRPRDSIFKMAEENKTKCE